MTNMTYIYGLRDPGTKLIRYVGKSDKPSIRLIRHLYRAKQGFPSHNYNWIRDLLRRSLRPELVLLMQVPQSNWKQVEALLIDSLRDDGHNITNIADGGFGGPFMKGRNRSKETRKKISEAHKALWTEERRSVWSERAKKQHSDLGFKNRHREGLSKAKGKISRIQKQRWQGNVEERERQSKTGHKVWADPEFRKWISKHTRQLWQNPEYREKQRQARIKAWQKRRVQ